MTDGSAVCNVSEAVARADGDRDLFLTLAGIFLEETPKDLAAAGAALAKQNGDALAAAAHRLKGAVVQVCAPHLYVSVSRLEQLGGQREFSAAAAVYADVETRLAEVHRVLREWIAGGLPA
ncbi:MAG: Hpt domain-containing protein [Nitrospira sp.]|nr:Hpt domain-containing protein [Nitrospira sp.]